jgi:RNA polymerase-binding transcription factor DksA
MATKKPAAKVAAKKPAAKKVAAPAKKATAPKKVVIAKKIVPAKKAAAKKVVPVKKVAAKVVAKKPAPKATPAKKAVPAKKVITKTPTKPAAKAVVKPAAKKVVVPIKKQSKPVAKKIETKKIVAKVAAAKVVAKPVVKEPTPDHIKALKKAMAEKSAAEKARLARVEAKKPLVMPKINTKTARKYEPDFTKSVLDKAPVDPGAAIVMYSDADLMEFKELIQRKLGSAKKELAYLQGLITRKDDTGGDDSDGRYMTMEDGSLSMEREQLSQMASRQITFVDHLEKALMRIENKTYGVCRVTGKLIDKARLRAVPHATLSIEAKMSSGK